VHNYNVLFEMFEMWLCGVISYTGHAVFKIWKSVVVIFGGTWTHYRYL